MTKKDNVNLRLLACDAHNRLGPAVIPISAFTAFDGTGTGRLGVVSASYLVGDKDSLSLVSCAAELSLIPYYCGGMLAIHPKMVEVSLDSSPGLAEHSNPRGYEYLWPYALSAAIRMGYGKAHAIYQGPVSGGYSDLVRCFHNHLIRAQERVLGGGTTCTVEIPRGHPEELGSYHTCYVQLDPEAYGSQFVPVTFPDKKAINDTVTVNPNSANECAVITSKTGGAAARSSTAPQSRVSFSDDDYSRVTSTIAGWSAYRDTGFWLKQFPKAKKSASSRPSVSW